MTYIRWKSLSDTMRKSSIFQQLETRLRSIVEDRLGQVFLDTVQPHIIARRLTEAIEQSDIDLAVPRRFYVVLNEDVRRLLIDRHAELAFELSEQLVAVTEELGLKLKYVPQVVLVGDPELGRDQMRVQLEKVIPTRQRTQQLDALLVENTVHSYHEAHLILENGQHIPLQKPIISIGRHSENDILIDDASVSRRHCQLRLRYGRYYLFDLQSKSGTLVNGHRVQEHRLISGDVISMAGAQLIYFEYDDSLGDTQVPDDE